MSKFSSVAFKEQNEGWLELLYDDAIRVVMPLRPGVAAPPAGSPPGEPAAGSLQLQGSGITTMSCTEPPCVKGVPPVTQPPAPDAIEFWMELLVGADVQVTACGASCLVIRGSSAEIAIPMFDAWIGTGDALCRALAGYCKLVGMKGCVAYHVYLITVVPDALAALRNKLIALPIPGRCVAKADDFAAAFAAERAVVAGDGKVAAAGDGKAAAAVDGKAPAAVDGKVPAAVDGKVGPASDGKNGVAVAQVSFSA